MSRVMGIGLPVRSGTDITLQSDSTFVQPPDGRQISGVWRRLSPIRE